MRDAAVVKILMAERKYGTRCLINNVRKDRRKKVNYDNIYCPLTKINIGIELFASEF